MTPEERAHAVMEALWGPDDYEGRKEVRLIAAAIREAVAGMRERAARVADDRAEEEAENPWCLDVTHEAPCRGIARDIRALPD